ncbi:hypothetical protein SAMN05421766_103378 [Zobellia uliginosa]|uniref:Lipocalin-like n=1 Tax=Zobellia uliginosa TaxID=143224 RepID=A0ABY1KTS7_9FLAO|nr:hypothetical protein [Zobellia uliginosa]SIS68605.1 hypothetical protein SAMN05421766_103378 [Zobellia uliginosa]
MKTTMKFYLSIFALGLFFVACDKSDDTEDKTDGEDIEEVTIVEIWKSTASIMEEASDFNNDGTKNTDFNKEVEGIPQGTITLKSDGTGTTSSLGVLYIVYSEEEDAYETIYEPAKESEAEVEIVWTKDGDKRILKYNADTDQSYTQTGVVSGTTLEISSALPIFMHNTEEDVYEFYEEKQISWFYGKEDVQ